MIGDREHLTLSRFGAVLIFSQMFSPAKIVILVTPSSGMSQYYPRCEHY